MNGGPRVAVKLSGLLTPPASTTFDHLNTEFKPYVRHVNVRIVGSRANLAVIGETVMRDVVRSFLGGRTLLRGSRIATHVTKFD